LRGQLLLQPEISWTAVGESLNLKCILRIACAWRRTAPGEGKEEAK